jgi:hypothetical protein
MKRLKWGDEVEVGDVVMVHMALRDKVTRKPFIWKWLGVIEEPIGSHAARVIRFGVAEGKDQVRVIWNSGDDKEGVGVWLLPPERWPDGVHAFRTKLILEGRLDGAIF